MLSLLGSGSSQDYLREASLGVSDPWDVSLLFLWSVSLYPGATSKGRSSRKDWGLRGERQPHPWRCLGWRPCWGGTAVDSAVSSWPHAAPRGFCESRGQLSGAWWRWRSRNAVAMNTPRPGWVQGLPEGWQQWPGPEVPPSGWTGHCDSGHRSPSWVRPRADAAEPLWASFL